jgi:hypothetical protein
MTTPHESPTPEQPEAPTPQWEDLAAMLASDPTLAAEIDPTPAEEAAPPIAPPAAEATAPVVAPAADIPTWDGQEAAGASFKALREEQTETKRQLAYLQGQLDAAKATANPTPAPVVKDSDPEPDAANYTDDAAYWRDTRAWDRREAVREARAELQPVAEAQAQQMFHGSIATAKAAVGEAEFTRYVQAIDQAEAFNPGAAARILSLGAGAGAEVIRVGRGLLGLQGAASPAPVDPQAEARALAAQRAAAGAPPPNPSLPLGPRGVGSGAQGAGVPDMELTPELIRTLNPEQLAAAQKEVLSKFYS